MLQCLLSPAAQLSHVFMYANTIRYLSEMSGGREDMKKTDSAQDHSECAEEARTMSAAISSTHQVDGWSERRAMRRFKKINPAIVIATAGDGTSPIRSAFWHRRESTFQEGWVSLCALRTAWCFVSPPAENHTPNNNPFQLSQLACWLFLLIDAINRFTPADVPSVFWCHIVKLIKSKSMSLMTRHVDGSPTLIQNRLAESINKKVKH